MQSSAGHVARLKKAFEHMYHAAEFRSKIAFETRGR